MADKIAQKKIRDGNIVRIVQTLLQHSSLSRMEIANLCGLAPGTVTQLVSPLLEEGIVEEFKVGDSTGGRRPISLRITPNYGCVPVFEIRRDGMTARVYDLGGEKQGETALATRMPTGNAMFSAITETVERIDAGEFGKSPNIIQAGLLCQDDIQDSELGVLYSTTADSDVIPLEMALRSRFDFPVRKDLIERFSLDHYLRHEARVRYENYGYINVGNSVIASFTLNGKRVEIDGEATFNLTPFLSGGALLRKFGAGSGRSDKPRGAVELAMRQRERKAGTEAIAADLAEIIRSASVFFPVDVIFLSGLAEDDSAAIEGVSGLIGGKPKVVGWKPAHRNISRVFVGRLLERSAASLAGAVL